MLLNGVSLHNGLIKINISLGPQALPLHIPLTPPESYILHEYRVMLQLPQLLGLNLGTKKDRQRKVLSNLTTDQQLLFILIFAH